MGRATGLARKIGRSIAVIYGSLWQGLTTGLDTKSSRLDKSVSEPLTFVFCSRCEVISTFMQFLFVHM